MNITQHIAVISILSIPLFAQPIYFDPAGNSGIGPDLLSIEATDDIDSWNFIFSFSPGTLNQLDFAFGLVLDTDLLGSPSPISGIPSTPDFGDDLYIYYNSLSQTEADVLQRISDTEAVPVGTLTLNWEPNTLILDVPRSIIAPTFGNAEFIIKIGLPTSPSSFGVYQSLPATLEPELITTTIPEPGSSTLLTGLAAAFASSFRRRRKNRA